MNRKTSSNTFASGLQALLVALSIAFALTACAYGVMTLHRIDATRGAERPRDSASAYASEPTAESASKDEVAEVSGSPRDVHDPSGANAGNATQRTAPGQWLLDQLDRHGAALLLVELLALAATTLALMMTDRGNPKSQVSRP